MAIRRSLGLVTLASIAVGAPLHAQASFDVGPLVGYYSPIGHFDPASVYSTALPQTPSDLRGLALGGDAQMWFTRRLGLDVQAAVSNSTIDGGATPCAYCSLAGPSSAQRVPTAAQVVIVTAQARYDISYRPETYRFFVSGGAGVVRHGGDAYARYGSPTSPAGAFGMGFSIPVVSGFNFSAGASAMLYPFDLPMPMELRGNPGSLQHGFQTDVLFHVGLHWGRQ
ncbi:MAG: hypothetical protein ABJE10_04580 [bacterium]